MAKNGTKVHLPTGDKSGSSIKSHGFRVGDNITSMKHFKSKKGK